MTTKYKSDERSDGVNPLGWYDTGNKWFAIIVHDGHDSKTKYTIDQHDKDETLEDTVIYLLEFVGGS